MKKINAVLLSAVVLLSNQAYANVCSDLFRGNAQAKIKDELSSIDRLHANGKVADAYRDLFNDGSTPLMRAAIIGDKQAMRTLIREGAKVDAQDSFGTTALMIAMGRGDKEMTSLLISAGANPKLKDEIGFTAADYARADGKTPNLKESMEILRMYIQNVNRDAVARRKPLTLNDAVKSGNTRLIEEALKSTADIHQLDIMDRTPLMNAILVYNGKDISTITKLIELGSDLNSRDNHGHTILSAAVNKSYPEVVKVLLEAGINPNSANAYGGTALSLAVIDGRLSNPAITKLLIDYGANVNKRDERGLTPLMVAARGGSVKDVALLIQAGADVSLRDSDGRNAHSHARDIRMTNERNEVLKALGDEK